MEVHLSPQQQAFIERSVRTGRFASNDDALREAVALLEDREGELGRLQAAVDEADDDIAQGRYSEYTDETLPQLLEELQREGRALRESEAGSPR
jgi:putative addiction module CopG family antidote